MTVAVATAEDPQLKKFLVYSLMLHGLLAVSLAVSIYVQSLRGPEWGGAGTQPGSAKVKLVNAAPAPGLPLPTPPTIKNNNAVDPNKGLWKEEQPKPPEPPTKAEKIAPFKKEKPLPPTHKSKIDEPKVPPLDNAVDYGKNRGANMPTNYQPNTGAGSGPVSVQGQGGGDFASRYAWYVESVRRTVSQNWLQSTIDPAVRAARQAHTVMVFRIYRDGSCRNIQMQQSSGNLSMDNSARRALDGIQFQALPSDFTGSYVDVIFDFDLSLTH
ncbi:MAG TPA: TonB C-terminal domain-containing protein [Candidatus Methylomirabilis sp.]|nr:TonB C-terminal domain-containing protein [Candidatus Methylomirabilis sp.]